MSPFAARFSRLSALLILLAGLAGCSSKSLDDFSLDDINPFAKDEEILPGARQSVITEVDPLTADPDASRNIPALPPQAGNAEWSQPGGTANNAPGHLALSSSVQRSWTRNAARGSSDEARLFISPIVHGGQIFVMDAEATVASISPGGGRSWSVKLRPESEDDDGVIGGGLAAEGGVIFAATGYGSVVALEAGSGRQLWIADLKVPMRSAPTVAGGRVFVVSADNKLYALATENGAEIWTYRGIPETAGLIANASPAVLGDTVVVPYSSGEVVAFKVETGEPIWSDTLTRTQLLTSLSALSDVAGRPAIDGDMVFAVSVSGRMVAVNRKTGERIWTRNVASKQMPYVAGQTVYVVSISGKVAALSRSDGKARWVTPLPGERGTQWNGPVLAGGQLWLSSSSEKLVSVDAVTGQVTGDYDIGEPSYIAPIVAAGSLFLLLDNGNLAAFN